MPDKKPWEQYSSTTKENKAESKPWEQYQGDVTPVKKKRSALPTMGDITGGFSDIPKQEKTQPSVSSDLSLSEQVRNETGSKFAPENTVETYLYNKLKPNKPDGIYKFPDNEEAVYKKEKGKWYIDPTKTGKFQPITTGDVEERTNKLEAKANRVEGQNLLGEQFTVFQETGTTFPEQKENLYEFRAKNELGESATPEKIEEKKTYYKNVDKQKRLRENGFDVDLNGNLDDPKTQKAFKLYEAKVGVIQKSKANTDKFISTVDNSVDLGLINSDEESVVSQLRSKFEKDGFIFDESGMGDAVTVSYSADGFRESEPITIDLQSFFSGTEEVDRLKGYMKQHYVPDYQKSIITGESLTNAEGGDEKELAERQYYNETVKLMASDPARYGSELISEDQFGSHIKNEYKNISSNQKQLEQEYASLDETITEFNKNPTKEQEVKINNEVNRLKLKQNALQTQLKEAYASEKNYAKAVGAYTMQESKKGNWVGGLAGSFMKGFTAPGRALLNISTDILPNILPNGGVNPSVYRDMKAEGLTDDQIKVRASSDLKRTLVKDIEQGIVNVGSGGSTTMEYLQSEDRGFMQKSVNALAESIGVASTGGGSKLLQTAAFFTQSYNYMEGELAGEEFDDMSAWEKKAISVSYGIVIGQLEKLGYKTAMGIGKNKVVRGLVNATLAKTFSTIPKGASVHAIEEAISKNLAATIASTGLKITSAGLVEGTTEASQQMAEIGLKQVVNEIHGKEYFENVPDLTTAKGLEEAIKLSLYDGAMGAVGGAIMGSFSNYSTNKNTAKADESFEVMYESLSDEKLRNSVKMNTFLRYKNGDITKEEAVTELRQINQTTASLDQIPAEYSIREKRGAFELLQEKQALENKIKGKDADLVVKETERINKIKEELVAIAVSPRSTTTDAVVDEPVATEETTTTTMAPSNFDAMIEEETVPERKSTLEAARNVQNALGTGTTVITHETSEDYANTINEYVTEQETEANRSSARYIPSRNEIHIDLDTADSVSVYHDAFHAKVRDIDKETLGSMVADLRSVVSGNKELFDRVDQFTAQYAEGDVNEETLAELSGIMAETATKLDKTNLQKFIEWVNKMATKIGLQSVLKKSASRGEVVGFMNDLSSSFREGRQTENTSTTTDTTQATESSRKISQERLNGVRSFDNAYDQLITDGATTENAFNEAMSVVDDIQDDTLREDVTRDINRKYGKKIKSAPKAERILGKKESKESKKERNDLIDDLRRESKAALNGAKSVIEAKGIILDYLNSSANKKLLSRADLNKILKIINSVKDEKSLSLGISEISSILHNVDADVIEVRKSKMLANIIRREAKAARDKKKQVTEVLTTISDSVKALQLSGKISVRQVSSILSALKGLNLDNKVAVNRFIDYMDKAVSDANFVEKINEAKNIRKTIKRSFKGKSNPFVGVAKGFSELNPMWVEDIDEYLDVANKVKQSLRPSTIRKGEISFKEEADIQEVGEYTAREQELQTEIAAENLRSEYERITGNSATGKEVGEMKSELLAEKIANSEDYSDQIKEALRERLDEFKQLVTTTDPKEVQDALKIDVEILDNRTAIQIIDALDSFIANGSTGGLRAQMASYQGLLNAKKSTLVPRMLRIGGIRKAGQYQSEQFTNINIMMERLYRGVSGGLQFRKESGFQGTVNGEAKSEAQTLNKKNEYLKKFSKRKDFDSVDNIFERGVIAFLRRNTTNGDIKEEFARRKKLLKDSVTALTEGNSIEKRKALAYQKVIDRLDATSDSATIQTIESKANKDNIEAVDFITNMWSDNYSELSDFALGVHNTMLSRDSNYTPDKFSSLSNKQALDQEIDGNSFGFSAFNNLVLDKNSAGVLVEARKPKTLPKGRYIDLEFDNNMFRSYRLALTDMYTAESIRQLDSYMRSPDFTNKMDVDDLNILNGAVSRYVTSIKGGNRIDKDTSEFFRKTLNTIGALAAGRALGGVGQSINQFSTATMNTFVNAGTNVHLSDLFNKKAMEFVARSGRGISNRGVDALTTIEKFEESLEFNSKTFNVLNYAPKKIAQANIWLLKQTLAKPDVSAARIAWLAYYRKSMKKQGLDVDYDGEVNDKAADYAQSMIDRNMDVSDTALRGKFFQDKTATKLFIKQVFFPFVTFALNQKNRMWSDASVLTNKLASKEDKAIAARSLVALSAESTVYFGIRYGIALAITEAVMASLGLDDEEKKEVRDRFNETTLKSIKTKSATDILSPSPVLDQYSLIGMNYLMELAGIGGGSDKEFEEKIKEENKRRYENYEKELTPSKIEEMRAKFDAGEQFQFFVDKESDMGMASIPFMKVSEAYQMAKTLATGKYTQESDYGDAEKTLSKEGQDKLLLPFLLKLGGASVFPREADQFANKSFKIIKNKYGTTGAQSDKISELEELGIKVDEDALKMIKAKKGVPKEVYALADEIRYVKSLSESAKKKYFLELEK